MDARPRARDDRSSRTEPLHVSVIVPLYDEEPNVTPLVDAVREALGDGLQWELLLVDDGSTDGTAERAAAEATADGRVRLLRLARNYGQTQALQAGFDHARGAVLVSMDGDLQNDPRDIPRLVERLGEGYDLVAGYRENRQDRWLTRKLPSAAANRIIRWLTGVPIRDNGCSLKAYRREVVERMDLYAEMHRFIPAVAAATAGARITELPVRHHPRRRGESKYGLSRVWKVMLDLLTIKMIHSFRERPLVLFGVSAAGAAALGFVFFLWSVAIALDLIYPAAEGALVFPSTALVWWTLAFYLLLLGLIGEIALREKWESRSQLLPVARERGTSR